jgi:hypothetical protein
MIRLKAIGMAAVLFVCAVHSAWAATITVQDSVDDYETQKRSSGTPLYAASENFGVARVGHQTNFNNTGTTAPGGIGAVFFFQLPALGPGDVLTGASFSVGLVADSATTAVTPTFNGDLYALGVLDTNPKSAQDAEKFFYLGNTAQASLPVVAGSTTVGGSVSRIADNFIVPADFVPNGGTLAAAPKSTDMFAYIQNLYANPAANGFTPGTSYLVMRVNSDADVPPTGTQRYSLAWQGTGPAGNGGAGTPENRPLIKLEIIPEPTSLMLVCVAMAAMGARARRR